MYFLLVTHVVFGVGSLLAAGGALLATKGGRRHRLWGRGYVAGMTVVCFSGLMLAVAVESVFLGCIALFSGYFVYSGARFAYRGEGRASMLDWLALGTFIAIATGMAVLAVVFYQVQDGRWIVLGCFAVLAFLLGYGDARHYGSIRPRQRSVKEFAQESTTQSVAQRGQARKARTKKHLAHMLGATIATTTAFTVTNIQSEPIWIAWLAPTALFLPLIFYWTRRIDKAHRQRMKFP